MTAGQLVQSDKFSYEIDDLRSIQLTLACTLCV